MQREGEAEHAAERMTLDQARSASYGPRDLIGTAVALARSRSARRTLVVLKEWGGGQALDPRVLVGALLKVTQGKTARETSGLTNLHRLSQQKAMTEVSPWRRKPTR